MKLEVPKLECKRCGHTWVPRKEVVEMCPNCKSRYWEKEKIQK